MNELVKQLVLWGPTVLFFLIVLIHTILGYTRGFRKSLILLIHSVSLFAILVGIYFFLVDTDFGDSTILVIINSFMGGEGGLQRALGVNESTTMLREVIVDAVVSMQGIDRTIQMILKDSGEYLYVLVNLIYHVAFALVLYVFYLILDLLMYGIYLIFYSNKRRIPKLEHRFMEGKSPTRFKMRRKSGLAIGLSRGLVSGLVSMSLLGSVFYIASGDLGKGTLEDKDFGDDNINMYYSMYQAIDSYGTNGIFKMLNEIKNQDDVPVYLFVADTILQGNVTITNEFNETHEYNLSLREELGNYVNITKAGVNLIAKYSEVELNKFIHQEISQDEFTNHVLNLFCDGSFQDEFSMIIDDVLDSNYVIDLAISLGCSVLGHFDELGLSNNLDPTVSEMMRVMFKKGYISPQIPHEQQLLSLKNSNQIVLPYISPSYFIDKRDALTITDFVFAILRNNEMKIEDAVRMGVPQLKKLSIMSSEKKKDQLDLALSRLYALVENTYLKSPENPETQVTSYRSYEELLKEANPDYYEYLYGKDKINWIDELLSLVDSIDELDVICEGTDFTQQIDGLAFIEGIFDQNNANYDNKMKAYDSLCDLIANSKMLGRVLSSSLIFDQIHNLFSAFSANYQNPEDLSFSNYLDEEGNTQYGEAYQVLRGLKLLYDPRNEGLRTKMLSGEAFTEADFELLYNAFDNKDETNNSIKDYFVDSKLMQSLVSSFLIDFQEGGQIYIPQDALVTNKAGEKVNIIEKSELEFLLDNLEFIQTKVVSSLQDIASINTLLHSSDGDRFLEISRNKIVQGTAANQLISTFDNNEDFVLPKRLKSAENWVSTPKKESELTSLLLILKETDFDLDKIISSGLDYNEMIRMLDELNQKDQIDLILSSDVLYYTISNMIESTSFNQFKLIVPNSCVKNLVDDTIQEIIEKDDLKTLVETIAFLDIDYNNFNESALLNKVVKNKQFVLRDKIFSASSCYYIANNLDSKLVIPQELKDSGTEKELRRYGDLNPWKKEFASLIDGVDELFDVSFAQGEIVINDTINDKVYEQLMKYDHPANVNKNYNKLELFSLSKIFSYSYTTYIDEALTEDIISLEARDLAKNHQIYEYNEVASLLEIVKDYHLESIADVQNFDFANETIHPLVVEILKKPYFEAYLARGIFSTQLEGVFMMSKGLRSHPFAYESYCDKLLKHSELIVLTKILGNNTLNSFDYNTFTLQELDSYIYNENQECSSYLTAASLTYAILNENGFVVPHSAMEKKAPDQITPYEIHSLLDVLSNNMNLDQIDNFDINDLDINKDLFKSDIVNATLTNSINIHFLSDSSTTFHNFVSIDDAFLTKGSDGVSNIVMLNEKESEAISNCFSVLSKGCRSLDFEIKLSDIITLSSFDFEKVISSSIARNIISDLVQYEHKDKIDIINKLLGVRTEVEASFDIQTKMVVTTRKVYNKDNLSRVMEEVKKI